MKSRLVTKNVALLSLYALVSLSIPQSFAAAAEPPDNSDEHIIHLLNRTSFGPSPGDIEHVKKVGIEKYIYEQLNPEDLPDPVKASGAAEFDILNGESAKLITQYREFARNTKQLRAEQKDDEAKEQTNAYFSKTIYAYQKARLLRDIKSPRQLEEVMTDFWYNHFNVFANKDIDKSLIGSYEEQAIRPFALGKFKQLVVATCHHPAMLYYLDNWQNTDPEAQGARGKFKGLNENYARELMELHTLGVDGGYTQEDVVELAKILTGLGVPQLQRPGHYQTLDNYGAIFDASRHDKGDKKFLGHVIKGSGEDEIEQAIDILVAQPATAHHIAYQIAQYFVADSPPAGLVDRLAETFSTSGGDIKEVLKTLFACQEFWDPQFEQNKFKTPLRYIVSCYRAAGSEPQKYELIGAQLRNQGQMLYGCLTPDGYKNVESAWLSPDALLKRIAFATQLASGQFKGGTSEPIDYKAILANTGGDNFFFSTGPKLSNQPAQLKAALLLGSPEFMRY